MLNHILVTGGAGFMGSAFIRYLLSEVGFQGEITNLDALTYAGNLSNLSSVENDARYSFVQGDINDMELLEKIYADKPFDTIVHFAAETHVDRSIEDPQIFATTNVLGTMNLLNFVCKHKEIRFHHISTDEVYGALGDTGVFSEESPYLPNSPYAASKAASDHFVRSYGKTYDLFVTISHASNNFGPCQYPEKFIPLMISNARLGKPLPVYGKGDNKREWLYVDDHSSAIWAILERGKSGEVYNVAGGTEMRNIDLLHLILESLEIESHDLITFVKDRPGHDFRYALDSTKMESELGWKPKMSFKEGLRKTVASL